MSATSTQPLLSKPTILSPCAVTPQELWSENLNMHMICRECKEFPPKLVEEFSSGDTVCGSCGLVLGDRIVDTRSEWRTFSNDDQGNDDPSRVGDGANPLLNGSQLQTSISFGDGSSSRTRDLHRAQNKSTHDKSTKGLLAAYKEIGALCDAMSIPKNVSDTAKHIFKMVNDAGAFRGKSQDTIIAGSIFIACRQCKVPRTFREICALTKVSKAEIGRIFKALENFFAAQNKERNDGNPSSGGKLKYKFTEPNSKLTIVLKALLRFMMIIKVPKQPVPPSSAYGSVANWGLMQNVHQCQKILPPEWMGLVHWRVAHLFPLQGHASTWHLTSLAKGSPPKTFLQLLELVMERFALHTK